MVEKVGVEVASIRPPTGSRRAHPKLVLVRSARGWHPYEIVNGHAIYERFVAAGWPTVQALLRDPGVTDPLELLRENASIPFLTAMQEAVAIEAVLADGSWTQAQLAREIGWLQPHISRRRLLLNLTHQQRSDLDTERITIEQAEVLARANRNATRSPNRQLG